MGVSESVCVSPDGLGGSVAFRALLNRRACGMHRSSQCADRLDSFKQRAASSQQPAASSQPQIGITKRQAAAEKDRNQVDHPKEDGLHHGLRLE